MPSCAPYLVTILLICLQKLQKYLESKGYVVFVKKHGRKGVHGSRFHERESSRRLSRKSKTKIKTKPRASGGSSVSSGKRISRVQTNEVRRKTSHANANTTRKRPLKSFPRKDSATTTTRRKDNFQQEQRRKDTTRRDAARRKAAATRRRGTATSAKAKKAKKRNRSHLERILDDVIT